MVYITRLKNELHMGFDEQTSHQKSLEGLNAFSFDDFSDRNTGCLKILIWCDSLFSENLKFYVLLLDFTMFVHVKLPF